MWCYEDIIFGSMPPARRLNPETRFIVDRMQIGGRSGGSLVGNRMAVKKETTAT